MTTIAAKATDTGKVKIAWDSQATSGAGATFGINKVVKINDQFAIGLAGRLRFANLIHRAAVNKIHPFDITQPDFDGYGWLLDEAVPAWMKAIRKELENQPEDDGAPYGEGVIALAGKIYELGVDFSIMPVEGYTAIGSGQRFAVAAMHLGKSAKQAVEVASDLDLFTGGAIKGMTV